jgi:hypothetical protein
MGRPPIGDKPMTKTELQRRWREGTKAKRLGDRITRLQAKLAELRAELTALRKASRERG